MNVKDKRCSKQVYEPQGFGRFHRCQRNAVVERDGEPYCKIHDPEYVKAKGRAKQAEWDKESAEKRAKYGRTVLIAGIFEGIDTETIKLNINTYRQAPRLYEACNAFKSTLSVWHIDPYKSPITLQTIFNETIGKAIAEVEKK